MPLLFTLTYLSQEAVEYQQYDPSISSNSHIYSLHLIIILSYR